MDPLVTVLITAYNTPPAFLKEAVASVLAQNYAAVDLLVVDDGSDPRLDSVLAGQDDARVRYLYIPHRGLPQALIQGMSAARGEYVAILDHDDTLAPNSLRCRVEAIRQSHAGLVYGDLNLMDGTGAIYAQLRYRPFDSTEAFVRAVLTATLGPLKHGGTLFDRKAVLSVGNYDADLPAEYDADLVVRVARGFGQLHVPELVLNYRTYTGNASNTLRFRARQIRCRWELIDRHMARARGRFLLKMKVGAVSLGKALYSMCLPQQRKWSAAPSCGNHRQGGARVMPGTEK